MPDGWQHYDIEVRVDVPHISGSRRGHVVSRGREDNNLYMTTLGFMNKPLTDHVPYSKEVFLEEVKADRDAYVNEFETLDEVSGNLDGVSRNALDKLEQLDADLADIDAKLTELDEVAKRSSTPYMDQRYKQPEIPDQKYGILAEIEIPDPEYDPMCHVVMRGLDDHMLYMGRGMDTYSNYNFQNNKGVYEYPKRFSKEEFVKEVERDTSSYASADVMKDLNNLDRRLSSWEADTERARTHGQIVFDANETYLNQEQILDREAANTIAALTRFPDLSDQAVMNAEVRVKSQIARDSLATMTPKSRVLLSSNFGANVIEPVKAEGMKFTPETMASMVELDKALERLQAPGIAQYAPETFERYEQYVREQSEASSVAPEHKSLFNKPGVSTVTLEREV